MRKSDILSVDDVWQSAEMRDENEIVAEVLEENEIFVTLMVFVEPEDDSLEIEPITQRGRRQHKLRTNCMQQLSFSCEDFRVFKNLFVKMDKEPENNLKQSVIPAAWLAWLGPGR